MSEPSDDGSMNTSSPTSGTESPETQRKTHAHGRKLDVKVLLASSGLFLSLLLEIIHLKTFLTPNASNFCELNAAFDCAAVAGSPYAIVLGVPWALWGALGFFTLIAAGVLRSRWFFPLALIAAFTSLALLLTSVFVIGSLCLLCEATHLVSFALAYLAFRDRHEFEKGYKDGDVLIKVFAPAAIVGIGLVTLLPSYWSAFTYKSDPAFTTGIDGDGHHWIGSKKPTLVIHEYVYHRCPYCKVGSTHLLRLLGEHSDWRIVRHETPLTSCEPDRERSCPIARMLYCSADQGKYWRADRWLFSHAHQKKQYDESQLVDALDLDEARFYACYRSAAAFTYGNKRYEDAREKGIINTPVYEFEGVVPPELEPLKELTPRRKKATK